LYVQTLLGGTPNPLTAKKRRFVCCNESSLSFCLLSDMLTIVSVIFFLEIPRLWRDISKKSDIEAIRLQ
ncbi:MAG: hypothetical protein IJB49_07350, partial [Clostridia bacterium]|nr:hypothetical protein [Clostridia bacterium]